MEPEIAALFQEFAVVIALPVQWGEQDAYGHVNNAVYFRWVESSRIAYTERLGFAELMRERQVGPILASVTCDYRRQITFPDEVRVGSRVTRIGRTSFAMEHRIVAASMRAVAAEARSTIVLFDYQAQRPTPLTDTIREAMCGIEQRAL